MADSALTVRSNWLSRALQRMRLIRAVKEYDPGSDFIEDQAATPAFSMEASMEAMARFPTVHRCVSTIAADLGSRPLYATKGRGRDAKPLDSHPLIELLENPTPVGQTSGLQLRRQLYVDYALTGNAFLHATRRDLENIRPGRPPDMLFRVHPERCKPVMGAHGEAEQYEVGSGAVARYQAENIVHVRDASWSSDPRSLYGQSRIEVLRTLLQFEYSATRSMANKAKSGKPDLIVKPPKDMGILTDDQVREIGRHVQTFRRSAGGVWINGWGLDVEQVSWSPKDMEYPTGMELALKAVLMVMGVTPTRVGIDWSNYATANVQIRINWKERQSDALLFDDQLTRLARLWPDSEDVFIWHGFDDVEELAESMDQQIERAIKLRRDLGVPVADALAYVGLEDVPTDNLIDIDAPTVLSAPESTRGEVERRVRQVVQMLTEADSLDAGEVADLRGTLEEAMQGFVGEERAA